MFGISGYTAFSPEEFDQCKGVIHALGERQGSFDVNDVSVAVAQVCPAESGQVSGNGSIEDLIGVLWSMEDLGYIMRVNPESTGPHRWVLVEA